MTRREIIDEIEMRIAQLAASSSPQDAILVLQEMISELKEIVGTSQ